MYDSILGFKKSRDCLLFAYRQGVEDEYSGDRTSNHQDARSDSSPPTINTPQCTCQKGTDTRTDKVGDHIDGIHSGRGLWAKFHRGALITELDTLHTDINDDDAKNQTYIRVVEERKDDPCCHL